MTLHSLEFTHRRGDPDFAARWPDFVDALDDDSIGWGFWGARQNFLRDPSALSAEGLRELALELTRNWHPHLRELIRMTEASTIGYIGVRTSVPRNPWVSLNVTLLGDAIHTMTPGRGAGANTALRDAALLGKLLVQASHGQKPLLRAMSEYETEMLRYSTEAVLESRKQMNSSDLIHKPVIGRLQLALVRGGMRVVNTVPALKRRTLQNLMRVRAEN